MITIRKVATLWFERYHVPFKIPLQPQQHFFATLPPLTPLTNPSDRSGRVGLTRARSPRLYISNNDPSEVTRDADEILASRLLVPPPPKFIPVDLAAPKLGETECPKLYVEDFKKLKSTDLSKYQRIKKSRYFSRCPEGVPQALQKDLALYNPDEKEFGIMVRPQALQVIRQMELYSKERDLRTGKYAISSKGFFIDGKRGVGKSILLDHLVWWAHEHGWIVLYIHQPDAYLSKCTTINRSPAGIYIQASFARQYLEKLVKSNGEKFAEIPVDMKYYGRCSLDGNDRTYMERVFNPLINKTINSELKWQLGHSVGRRKAEFIQLVESLNENNERSLELLKRKIFLKHQIQQTIKTSTLSAVLPNPSSLLDIVQKGAEHAAYSTTCLYELIRQLKNQTQYPVLVAVDNFNLIFKVSKYVSIHYDLTKFNGYIPGYHLALPRLFIKWDGHHFKRGIKIAATTWLKDTRRDFDPQLLGVSEREIIHVDEFSPRELDNFLEFGASKGAIVECPKFKVPYFYMMSGGNGEMARKTLATFY